MKEIKLDCFNGNEICRIASDFRNFSISSPTENQYSLKIFNQSESDCDIEIELKEIKQNIDLSLVKVIITKEKELFFQDNLEVFFKQKIFLSAIRSKSFNEYFFTFDFINLSLENKKINLNFDFFLNFDCRDLVGEVLVTPDLKDIQISQEKSKSEVLAAIDDKSNPEINGNSNFLFSPIFYFLSSLFIVVFFVIIKVVNGKKKKNTE